MLSIAAEMILSGRFDEEVMGLVNGLTVYTTEELLTANPFPEVKDKIYVLGSPVRNKLLVKKFASKTDFIANVNFVESSNAGELIDIALQNNVKPDEQFTSDKPITYEERIAKIEREKRNTSGTPEVPAKYRDDDGSKEEDSDVRSDNTDIGSVPKDECNYGVPIPIKLYKRSSVDILTNDYEVVGESPSYSLIRERVDSYFS